MGELPALWVVAGWYVFGLPLLFLSDDTARAIYGGTGLLLLAACCGARSRYNWEVFGWAAFPASTAVLLHDFLGAPRWLALALIPVGLALAWSLDRRGLPARMTRTPRAE